jgi:predicted Rossmann-fold nucleotide-binding protein
MKSVCLFCGSNKGTRPEYVAAAAAFGRTLAEEGITLVYGAGKVGLMGVAADAALAAAR